MPKLWHRSQRPPPPRRMTTLTLSADDLTALGELLAAGRVLLQHRAARPPVLARVKAALTRFGLPVPIGL
jgi:hypothetical protein